MISGHVNEDLEAVIRLSLRNARGEEHEFTAVVDTGFNGALTMRPEIIKNLAGMGSPEPRGTG
jgi:predicted aspartyl protease